ncbi:putative Transporter, gluconate:H+ symporter family [Magnetospirillum sp. SS-4]|nr:putative Transporter, gluconate:H+ symporter family [Magnetospirillum sp. SS-4]
MGPTAIAGDPVNDDRDPHPGGRIAHPADAQVEGHVAGADRHRAAALQPHLPGQAIGLPDSGTGLRRPVGPGRTPPRRSGR